MGLRHGGRLGGKFSIVHQRLHVDSMATNTTMTAILAGTVVWLSVGGEEIHH